MIKIDMPMPTCCLLCPISVTDDESPFFDAYCNLLKRYIEAEESDKIQDDCPIEETYIDQFKDKSIEQLMDECFNRGYRKAERHGKWEVVGKTTRYYICSNCGKPGDGWDNYCRNCGARMDGGTENEID